MEERETIKRFKNDIKGILSTSERFVPHPDYMEKYKNYIIHEAHNQDEYFLEFNLALLKLYQLYPALTNHSFIVCILLKAMMAIPKKDFLLCKYMLTPSMLQNENVASVVQMNTFLENADYVKFWELLNMRKYLIKEIDGFENTIRTFILSVIGMTFKVLKRNYVLKQIDMRDNDPSFDAMIYELGWKQDFDDLVIGDPKTSKTEPEKFDVETMKKLMPVLRPV